MARPRKPTAALELRGAFKKDPKRGRDRADEPKPTSALGEPPSSFNEEVEGPLWREMASEAFWLTGADKFMFEIAVRLMAKHRGGTIDRKEIPQLLAALNKLGFGPAERSKIKAPGGDDKPKKPEGFEGFE